MNARLSRALLLRDTDVEGAIHRLCGDEALYISCLKAFLDDPTMGELNVAIEEGLYEDAITAALALKGLAGNMGFVPLMHSTGRLLEFIRGGQAKETRSCLLRINSSYRDIVDAIEENFPRADADSKGETT